MSKHRMAVRLNLPTLLGALALTSITGCGADGDGDNDERAQVDSELDGSIDASAADAGSDDAGSDADAGPDAGGPIVGIDGGLAKPHITRVVAKGTACAAADDYTAAIAPDGQSVTVTLRSFELNVSSESSLDVKDCQLGIEVTAEDGKQYQLSRASLNGVIALEEGVSARLLVNRYFQGDPVVGEEWRTDLTGPINNDLVLDAPEASESWSPCGVARDVNVRFTSRLTNTNAPGLTGYVKVDQVQVFNLNSRACTD